MEKKSQEKMRKISELNDFLKEIGQKNNNHFILFPNNYNNFVEIFTDEVKFSKEHLPAENLEGALKEMKVNFDLKNQVKIGFNKKINNNILEIAKDKSFGENAQ